MKIFILDDDLFFLTLLKNEINNIMTGLSEKASVTVFDTEDAFFNEYNSPVDIVFLDYHLGNHTSERTLKKILDMFPKQNVVMLSGQDDGDIVLGLIKMGLRSYVIKDDDHYENIKELIQEELEMKK